MTEKSFGTEIFCRLIIFISQNDQNPTEKLSVIQPQAPFMKEGLK